MIERAFVTPHAVRRWQQRIHRGVGHDQAIREILEALEICTLRSQDADGTEHWRAPKRCRWGQIRFRLRPGRGPLPAVVTVLPEYDDVRRSHESAIEQPRFTHVACDLYRSPIPLAREVRAFAELGGRALVDLTRRPRPSIERACRRYGVAYVKHGLPYDFNEDQIMRAAALVLAQPRPVLVHCFHGRDRTGAVVSSCLAMLEVSC